MEAASVATCFGSHGLTLHAGFCTLADLELKFTVTVDPMRVRGSHSLPAPACVLTASKHPCARGRTGVACRLASDFTFSLKCGHLGKD